MRGKNLKIYPVIFILGNDGLKMRQAAYTNEEYPSVSQKNAPINKLMKQNRQSRPEKLNKPK
jgi:hypothetical protein